MELKPNLDHQHPSLSISFHTFPPSEVINHTAEQLHEIEASGKVLTKFGIIIPNQDL